MQSTTDHEASVRKIFDDWARRGRAEGMEQGHGPTARQAFDMLALGAGDRYLDIGCGNGYTVRWAATHAENITAAGIDLADEMIERARAASAGIARCEFAVSSFPSVPFGPESFDAIFSMEVFYYLSDLSAGLSQVRSLLAPGGRFACIVDFYRENTESHGWSDDLGIPLTLLSADEWRSAVEAAGLRVERQTRLHPPLAKGEAATWKHTEGSLLTLAVKPS
jgi:cyclopropane fatty-acyl-phospholipid synthase-like methyltransferase